MSDINRATLPAEFFDTTSIQLLTEPEPQYLHALLAKMAMSASFSADGALGLQLPARQFGAAGAPYKDAEEGRLSLSDGLYDQAVHFVSELGKSPGHTVRLNRPVYEDTSYGVDARGVPASTVISTTPISVSSDQVPITLNRLAGPYSTTQNAVAPYGIDRFDTSVSLHRPAQIVGANLKRDFDKNLDQIMVRLFDQASTVIRPAGMTTDDTAAVAGDYPMSYRVVQAAERDLDEKNIPKFGNGRRILVITPRQAEQLTLDPDFNRLAESHPQFNPLFNGAYWKTIGGFDIFKSNTLLKPNNTNSVRIDHAQAFGPGAVGAGQGELPRTAYSTADNYGETALVIWLWYAGFATLDSRFITSIRTS